jgi:hypothetical protein
MIGLEGTLLNLEWRTYQQTNSDRSLRDGSFCKRIPGSKLPGYLHLVPPGRNPGHQSTNRLHINHGRIWVKCHGQGAGTSSTAPRSPKIEDEDEPLFPTRRKDP